MSVDGEAREAERHWREAPEDEGAFERAVGAYRRAGLDLPYEMLVRTPRWKLLVEFARDWMGRPIGSDDGITLEEIETLGRKHLGQPYPEALREWLFLVGARGDFLEGPFLSTCLLEAMTEDEGVVPICIESQAVVRFGIERPRLLDADPPIVAKVLDGLEEWRPVHERASEFFLSLSMFFRVIAARADEGVRVGQAFMGDMERVIRVAEGTYSRLPVASWPWPTDNSRFLGDKETIVYVSQFQIDAAARTPEAWARLDALVRDNGGIWSSN